MLPDGISEVCEGFLFRRSSEKREKENFLTKTTFVDVIHKSSFHSSSNKNETNHLTKPQVRRMLFVLISAITILLVLGFVVFPLILALRDTFKEYSLNHSKLYTGRVWHRRFQPKRHAFTYPIFIFALDLEENLKSFLSPILKFRESDHLKNGEGILKEAGANNSLLERVLRLVSERTKGKCTPTTKTHRITLLTHVSDITK